MVLIFIGIIPIAIGIFFLIITRNALEINKSIAQRFVVWIMRICFVILVLIGLYLIFLWAIGSTII